MDNIVWIKIKSFFLRLILKIFDLVDWIKIVLQSISGVYGVLIVCDGVATRTMYGNKKVLFALKNRNVDLSNLPQEVKTAIDITIERTKDYHWQQFINFVYSAYPIITSKRYSFLKLAQKVGEYKYELEIESIGAKG